jgi:hypothetical protein
MEQSQEHILGKRTSSNRPLTEAITTLAKIPANLNIAKTLRPQIKLK